MKKLLALAGVLALSSIAAASFADAPQALSSTATTTLSATVVPYVAITNGATDSLSFNYDQSGATPDKLSDTILPTYSSNVSVNVKAELQGTNAGLFSINIPQGTAGASQTLGTALDPATNAALPMVTVNFNPTPTTAPGAKTASVLFTATQKL